MKLQKVGVSGSRLSSGRRNGYEKEHLVVVRMDVLHVVFFLTNK